MVKISKIRDTYRKLPIQVKASGWFFICSLVQKAIAVISTIIFTRLMSSEDYGILSIYNSWSDIIYIFATLNLSTGVYNVGMTKFNDRRNEFNSSLQLLALFWTLTFGLLFLCLYHYIEVIIQLPFKMIIIMFITFCTLPAYNLWCAKQRYESKYRSLVVVTVLYAIIILLASLIAVVYCRDKSFAKILSNAIIIVLFGGGLFFRNLCFKGKKINKEFVYFALKFNLPMIPAFLAMVILNQIDRIMISNQVSLAKAGIYSVAYNSAMFISILSTAINATYNPWLMQKIHNKEFGNISEITKIISVLFICVILVFIILAPELIKVMASSEYYEAIYVVPPVAASTFFTLIYTYYCPFAQYYLKMRFLVFINIGVAILNVILNYFGIMKFGYLAAGYTTYIGYLIYGWGTVFYVNKLIIKNFENKKIYDNKFLFIITIVLTMIMILINFLYKTYVIRYLLLYILLMCLWLYRKKIILIIKSLRC